MVDGDFRLLTLGRLELLAPSGEPAVPLARRRRKLALLAVLAVGGGSVARDALAEMFWGGRPERRARHSLSDALSEIRRVMGPEALVTRGDEVALAAGAALDVDALAFEAACETGDWARATALYRGPFLECVFVRDAPSFETWVAARAARLEQAFADACEAQVGRLRAAGRWSEVAALAARWSASRPLAAEPALELLAALREPGTPAAERAALGAYDRLAARLLREYDAAPPPDVVAVAAEIRNALAAKHADPPAFPLSPVRPGPDGMATKRATASRATPLVVSRPRRSRVGRWVGGAAAVGLLSLAALGFELARREPETNSAARPVVAILGIRDLRGDTTAAWIGEGLTQMIAADLARSPALEIVAPERVRRTEMSTAASGADPSGSGSSSVGRTLGATWIVTGGLTRGDTTYVLDVDLHDVAAGRSLGLLTIQGRTLPTLADRAAARVIAMARSHEPGPRFADVETASLEAYEHFVHAQELRAEGRDVDGRTELDRAIALDSGFVTALAERMRIAWQEADGRTLDRLTAAYRRARSRATPWDRLELDTYAALRSGRPDHGAAMARQLLERYPHDPRAYGILAGVLQDRGDWPAADSVLHRELALDSAGGAATGRGCASCAAFGALSTDAIEEGRLAASERLARRWIAARPYLPAAWSTLATALEAEGHFEGALAAARRARLLAPYDPVYDDHLVRALLVARRYAAADTAIARMGRSTDREARVDALDLEALLERERGLMRASIRTIETARSEDPRGAGVLGFEEGSSLAAIGEWTRAAALDERLSHPNAEEAALDTVLTPVSGLEGGRARQFCWGHALEAEALAGSGDTLRLRRLADSIEQASRRSYYGRDRLLAFHVRGLIAELEGRQAEAERDFRRARWGYAGWTATLVHLARAELALGRAEDAVTTLREARAAPLDAMGRYVPHSELDLWTARAFRAAGRADSAAVYRRYVERAWRRADPEIRARLNGF